ncbi:MAG TPA: type II secretion system F family protein [Candidatus Dormibacteraeota bacterium]
MGGAVALGLVGCAGVVLAAVSVDLARRHRAPAANPAELWMRSFGSTVRAEDIELQTPFDERIIAPFLRRARAFLSRRTPEGQRQAIEQQLDQAGRPANLSATDLTLIRYAAAVLGLVLGAAIAFPRFNPLIAVAVVAVATYLAFLAPSIALRTLANSRRNAIQKALPDALDLMVISVEAGLSLDGAIQQVGGKLKGKNPLGDEFERVVTEIHLGNTRQDALYGMARRTGLDDVNQLVTALAQSEQMGVPIAKMLRTYSEALRAVRRQRAQERGGRAGLLMLFPMIGCIFPTIWIILVGPALLILIATGHI